MTRQTQTTVTMFSRGRLWSNGYSNPEPERTEAQGSPSLTRLVRTVPPWSVTIGRMLVRQPVAVALAFQQLDIGFRAMLANSAISGVGVPRLQLSGHETRCRTGIM